MMFDLDLSKFAFLHSEESENDRLGRKSSNLPRLSKENLKLHSKWFDQQSQIRVEVESASSCSNSEMEIDTTLKPDFDYDYASIYSEFSDCDSGHQTVSGCGSGGSRNKNAQLRNGLLAPPSLSKSKSGRFRSVSFNENENDEEQDEDGYSFVSYSSASASGTASGQPQKIVGGGSGAIEESSCTINIVGNNVETLGPFGLRKCVYLDNGRAVSEIEHFVQKHVLLSYSVGATNSKLLEMRDESKQIIHEKCGGSQEDQIIFCHGSSSPIQTLAKLLMKKPSSSSLVVIIGPFQTSAAISAWRLVAHEVIIAPVNPDDQVDLKWLEGRLKSLKRKQILKSRLVIGSFTAASHVSGTLNNDDVAITALLHKYGAYSVWDYGVAGPHSEIQMNPKTGSEALDKVGRKDAIFFSGSQFLGGPQTPDVLIAKKSMFRNQEYITELAKSVSTSLIGEIRLGLVFQLHDSIGYQTIAGKETDYNRQTLEAWEKIGEIVILGSTETQRLPIISFLIKHPETGYFLHHEFVMALLCDLFGIQSTTGSMSDSPHAQKLLGIEDKLAKKYERCQSIQPGFTTIFLRHTATPEEINFTVEAVKLIATQGWKLLPFYEKDRKNGTIRFSGTVETEDSQKAKLKSFTLKSQSTEIQLGNSSKPISKYRYDKCLTYGKDLIDSIEMITQHNEITHSDDFSSSLHKPSLRWFLTPSEALKCIKHPYTDKRKRHQCPFAPQRFAYNCETTESPPLPPRTIKKSTSLRSLDMKFNTDVKKVSVGVPFSRREFQSKLNNSYFDDSDN